MISSIVFDWKRTLYNPDESMLIDGAHEILELFRENGVPLVLVGKGGKDMYSEVKRLGVGKYFEQIVFQEGTKEDTLFRPYVSKESPSTTFFIGDRVRSELAVGKSLGATTIWVRQGRFAEEMPESEKQKPDHIVSSLTEDRVLLVQKFGLK